MEDVLKSCTIWDVYKTPANNGINYLYQLVIRRISEPSTVVTVILSAPENQVLRRSIATPV